MSKPTSRPSHEAAGIDGLQLLAWDSNFLGFPVARLVAQRLSAVDLDALMIKGRKEGIRLIYLMADPADIETAAATRQVGVRLIDRKVTFVRGTAPALPASAAGWDLTCVIPVAAYTPRLEQLAWESGQFSRFRTDDKFEPHIFTNMYNHWLRASVNGELAQVVFTYLSPTGSELGLLTLGQQERCASIGLLAVDAEVRGHGLGQRLVEVALQQALQWGCTQLQVVTQRDNEPACRFYNRCGFEVEQEQHIYHLWL
ncbi:MAG TPA: GNAT family N-acetyltransferase [Hymenobacter sp.]|jgi:dTDP-4-amino-4,6-dideoxy-D-galactose acyltransferase